MRRSSYNELIENLKNGITSNLDEDITRLLTEENLIFFGTSQIDEILNIIYRYENESSVITEEIVNNMDTMIGELRQAGEILIRTEHDSGIEVLEIEYRTNIQSTSEIRGKIKILPLKFNGTYNINIDWTECDSMYDAHAKLFMETELEMSKIFQITEGQYQ